MASLRRCQAHGGRPRPAPAQQQGRRAPRPRRVPCTCRAGSLVRASPSPIEPRRVGGESVTSSTWSADSRFVEARYRLGRALVHRYPELAAGRIRRDALRMSTVASDQKASSPRPGTTRRATNEACRGVDTVGEFRCPSHGSSICRCGPSSGRREGRVSEGDPAPPDACTSAGLPVVCRPASGRADLRAMGLTGGCRARPRRDRVAAWRPGRPVRRQLRNARQAVSGRRLVARSLQRGSTAQHPEYDHVIATSGVSTVHGSTRHKNDVPGSDLVFLVVHSVHAAAG